MENLAVLVRSHANRPENERTFIAPSHGLFWTCRGKMFMIRNNTLFNKKNRFLINPLIGKPSSKYETPLTRKKPTFGEEKKLQHPGKPHQLHKKPNHPLQKTIPFTFLSY
jgi:hypothetical protein